MATVEGRIGPETEDAKGVDKKAFKLHRQVYTTEILVSLSIISFLRPPRRE